VPPRGCVPVNNGLAYTFCGWIWAIYSRNFRGAYEAVYARQAPDLAVRIVGLHAIPSCRHSRGARVLSLRGLIVCARLEQRGIQFPT